MLPPQFLFFLQIHFRIASVHKLFKALFQQWARTEGMTMGILPSLSSGFSLHFPQGVSYSFPRAGQELGSCGLSAFFSVSLANEAGDTRIFSSPRLPQLVSTNDLIAYRGGS